MASAKEEGYGVSSKFERDRGAAGEDFFRTRFAAGVLGPTGVRFRGVAVPGVLVDAGGLRLFVGDGGVDSDLEAGLGVEYVGVDFRGPGSRVGTTLGVGNAEGLLAGDAAGKEDGGGKGSLGLMGESGANALGSISDRSLSASKSVNGCSSITASPDHC